MNYYIRDQNMLANGTEEFSILFLHDVSTDPIVDLDGNKFAAQSSASVPAGVVLTDGEKASIDAGDTLYMLYTVWRLPNETVGEMFARLEKSYAPLAEYYRNQLQAQVTKALNG